MKKLILLSVFLFLGAAVSAQLTFGPKIGITMSKLSVDKDDYTEELKTGFQLGAFVRVGKKVFLQPEVMFSTTGGVLKTEDRNLKTTVKLNTVQVPVLVGYKFINFKLVNLRVMAGPAISMIVNKDIEFDEKIENPIKEDDLKNASWTFQLGGGVDVMMLTLDVRYEWGLNNIHDPEAGLNKFDMKNNLWTVSLGWKIL
ncbi:MAG: porin family protein [Bacteroidales bacterium]|nr:porin family protein [Bacteroidales bacterium]